MNILIKLLVISLFLVNCLWGQDFDNSKKNAGFYTSTKFDTIKYEKTKFDTTKFQSTKFDRVKFVSSISTKKIRFQEQSFDTLTFDELKNRYKDKYDINWEYVAKRVGIGATVIVVTGTVALISGAVGLEPISGIAIVSFKEATLGAVTGAAIGGGFEALLGYFEDGSPAVKKKLIEGAADGFMWGAILGAVYGVAKPKLNCTTANSGLICSKYPNKKNPPGAISIGAKKFLTAEGMIFNESGNVIGKAIRYVNVDDLFYVGKNSTSVFDKTGKEIAKIAKYKENFVLYNKNGRILGYIKNGKLVSYCDASSAAIVKGQNRAQPGFEVRKQVEELAKANGQYNPKTGKFLDAVDGSEIIGTPDLGHIPGHEYVNELQRAYMNGLSESAFRENMRNPAIYQLESVNGNRNHAREGVKLTIDSFRNVDKNVGEKVWNAL